MKANKKLWNHTRARPKSHRLCAEHSIHCLPRPRIHPIPQAPSLLPPGRLRIAQQPAGVHQLVEGFADDFRVVQQVPLLAVDVAGREAVRAVERAGFDAGQFAGCLALQGLAEGEDAPGVGFQIVAPAGGSAPGSDSERW
jgi:hypothetical protein